MATMFLRQDMMTRVLYALAPLAVFSVYLFGWQVIPVIVVSNLFAFLTEWLFIRKKKNGRVSMAVFVTGTLLALTLPPGLPLWMAAVGAVVGVAFGKMVFGGFGMNLFNPAIVGRTFLYVSFPNAMQIEWFKPVGGFPGGFAVWRSVDNMTMATAMKDFRISGTFEGYSLPDLFLGTVPGSMGETSALLIMLAGIYLIITRTAKWEPMVATLISTVVFSLIMSPGNPLYALFSGGLLFGVVFMVTDPVSMPKDKTAIWIYGLLVGFLTVFIRTKSLFPEGFMFALLLGNTFMPIIEYAIVKTRKSRTGGTK